MNDLMTENANLANSIEPRQLEKLMEKYGWEKVKTFPDVASVWRSADASRTQWVPLSHEYEGYGVLAMEVCEIVADEKSAQQAKLDQSIDIGRNQKNQGNVMTQAEFKQWADMELEHQAI